MERTSFAAWVLLTSGQLSEELSRSVFFLDYLGEWLWILGGWYPLHLWWA